MICHGFFVSSRSRFCYSPVTVVFGFIGLQSDCFVVILYSSLMFPQLIVHRTSIGVEGSLIWP